MNIEVALRETIEEGLEIFSVEGSGLAGGSLALLHDLEAILDSSASNQQLLLKVVSHLLDWYSSKPWVIRVKRWDGHTYSFRFDPTTSESTVVPEPVVPRRSRYSREPVI